MSVAAFEPRRHDAPDGWPPDVFGRVTDALALALVNAYKRGRAHDDAREEPA